MENVTMVRIYLTEHDPVKELIRRLHDVERVRGVSVFRAISGFGPSGVEHTSSLVDLSLDLPVVIEFFDAPAKVEKIVAHIQDTIAPAHLVTWPAQTN